MVPDSRASALQGQSFMFLQVPHFSHSVLLCFICSIPCCYKSFSLQMPFCVLCLRCEYGGKNLLQGILVATRSLQGACTSEVQGRSHRCEISPQGIRVRVTKLSAVQKHFNGEHKRKWENTGLKQTHRD